MLLEHKIAANPSTVFREEFDDWALLYNPETGSVYGLNPVGAFIRKRMDGNQTIGDFVELVKSYFEEVPSNIEQDITVFIEDLVNKGFVEYNVS
jgi:SynChlorMet cassette protein ScmD